MLKFCGMDGREVYVNPRMIITMQRINSNEPKGPWYLLRMLNGDQFTVNQQGADNVYNFLSGQREHLGAADDTDWWKHGGKNPLDSDEE